MNHDNKASIPPILPPIKFREHQKYRSLKDIALWVQNNCGFVDHWPKIVKALKQ